MAEPNKTLQVKNPRHSPDAVLIASGLCKAYDAVGEPVHALRGLSLEVRKGEFVAIMGASGSGKSTLLHLLAGLDEPSGGTIVVEGHDLGRMTDRERTLFRRRRLGIVFQAYNLLPTLTAEENVLLPALLDGTNHRDKEQRAKELLKRVGLEKRLSHRPQALAGGEQQRVAIARALINDPAVILADEPTGNLDTARSMDIWRLLVSLVREEQCTVVAVTHEPSGATFSDRVIILKDGLQVGEVSPGGEDHAALVASGYRDLVG